MRAIIANIKPFSIMPLQSENFFRYIASQKANFCRVQNLFEFKVVNEATDLTVK